MGCSVRQGKEASIPLNSCEKSGIFTLGSSCTYRRCRKCKADTFDLRRMALEKLQEKREQTLGIIIYQLELTPLFCSHKNSVPSNKFEKTLLVKNWAWLSDVNDTIPKNYRRSNCGRAMIQHFLCCTRSVVDVFREAGTHTWWDHMQTVQGSLASFLWNAIRKISGGGVVINKVLNGEAPPLALT